MLTEQAPKQKLCEIYALRPSIYVFNNLAKCISLTLNVVKYMNEYNCFVNYFYMEVNSE